MLKQLEAQVKGLGKSEWQAVLTYVAELHGRSVLPAREPLPYPYEEIGPGYCYGPAFGHWDIVHQLMDSMHAEPEHVKQQLINNLAAQHDDGFVPGSIWFAGEKAEWSKVAGHPPVWPVAVQDYYMWTQDVALIKHAYQPLRKLIDWYEANRKAEGNGYFYTDILNRAWESGVDEGVRFDESPSGKLACIDATSHVYWLYQHAYQWSELLGKEEIELKKKAEEIGGFIREELFDPRAGFFYDIWSIHEPDKRVDALEGMWPIVVGAATSEQANQVIDRYLLNENKFFTTHPLATVAADSPKFELRMWRGPVWNSMTYWAARGCAAYGRKDASRKLLEKALDASAKQFAETGTIWEFYHPYGGRPTELARKPHTEFNTPCTDYLGHNPLIAMAKLWEKCGET